jgi:hypothetical protein
MNTGVTFWPNEDGEYPPLPPYRDASGPVVEVSLARSVGGRIEYGGVVVEWGTGRVLGTRFEPQECATTSRRSVLVPTYFETYSALNALVSGKTRARVEQRCRNSHRQSKVEVLSARSGDSGSLSWTSERDVACFHRIGCES